ncbi:RGCVC family protein [Nocardia sp. NPDC049149]|uniref:RGCVC family protein n=1 Tax=Nocardia sp. NPDC049149 TaxID=3364315 RepID=UPI00371DE598
MNLRSLSGRGLPPALLCPLTAHHLEIGREVMRTSLVKQLPSTVRGPAEIATSSESSCLACPHAWEAHDPIGVRYCAATKERGLDRACVCARPAGHENTYYR